MHLEVFYEDGSSELVIKNAAVWKDGVKEITILLPSKKSIKKIELLNRLVPDADISNNVYIFNN